MEFEKCSDNAKRHASLGRMAQVDHQAAPQLHADVSWINWDLPREEFHRYLKSFVTAGFTDRLME